MMKPVSVSICPDAAGFAVSPEIFLPGRPPHIGGVDIGYHNHGDENNVNVFYSQLHYPWLKGE